MGLFQLTEMAAVARRHRPARPMGASRRKIKGVREQEIPREEREKALMIARACTDQPSTPHHGTPPQLPKAYLRR